MIYLWRVLTFFGPVNILIAALQVAFGVMEADVGKTLTWALVFALNVWSWTTAVDIVANEKLIAALKEQKKNND